MSEIKVGEYVRTDNGISKVIKNVDRYVTEKQISVDFIGGIYHQVIYKKRIIKHSKDIIDLIEIGDYVNGQEVVNVEGFDKNGDDKEALGIIDIDGDYAYGVFLEDIPIRTIVTKEQFKEMEYRV